MVHEIENEICCYQLLISIQMRSGDADLDMIG